MARLLRLFVYAALLTAALAGSAHAAPAEHFSLEITYTGSGDLTQTRPADCYDGAGEYHRGVTYTWQSTVQWTTIYPLGFFVLPGGKQLGPGGNQLGNAEYDTHQLTGSYTSDGSPCMAPGGGTLAEVNGVNQPEPSPYMPAFGIFDGQEIEFRLAPTRSPGETNRERMFATQYSSVGYGTSNWNATKSAPDTPGAGAVYSLTGIFTVSLLQLRDLTEGRRESLELDVQQPSLPDFQPWPPSGGTIASTMAGHVKIIATCFERTKTGTGYTGLESHMKRALTKLYKELDRQKACYRFTIGYRSAAKQKKLYDRWHEIADSQGPNDQRSAEQVCAAVRKAGFAQCPSGGSNFRNADGVAKGGPAKPGRSRHEYGEAADITVRFPPTNLKNLDKYQAAARKAGLCGPPKGDDVHVEFPYSAKKGKPVRCHFPPGPAP